MRNKAYVRRGSAPEPRGGFAPATPKPKPPKKEKQESKRSAAASLPLVGIGGHHPKKEMKRNLPEMGLKR